jgi:hypothetical protein
MKGADRVNVASLSQGLVRGKGRVSFGCFTSLSFSLSGFLSTTRGVVKIAQEGHAIGALGGDGDGRETHLSWGRGPSCLDL